MQKLTDQDIAQCLLKDEKFSCNFINSCIQEAADNNLRRDWQNCLQNSQQMQKQVFDAMNQKGWYSPAKADMQQMSQAQNQFSQNQMQ
ncbi:spore coat protein [Dethiobacter alkaliphilus]|uniref:spore coat protein n=1 Tax=Dethiobacter alkaliphilus TaxID=427926 RepID=UPI002227986B|nr:spore coat protein [Dethiobacter alkaliphilus]MCW3489595.1 spore coat protein [Dethiobacter alkaliphilus]